MAGGRRIARAARRSCRAGFGSADKTRPGRCIALAAGAGRSSVSSSAPGERGNEVNAVARFEPAHRGRDVGVDPMSGPHPAKSPASRRGVLPDVGKIADPVRWTSKPTGALVGSPRTVPWPTSSQGPSPCIRAACDPGSAGSIVWSSPMWRPRNLERITAPLLLDPPLGEPQRSLGAACQASALTS